MQGGDKVEEGDAGKSRGNWYRFAPRGHFIEVFGTSFGASSSEYPAPV